MKGVTILLLCAAALTYADRPQLSGGGRPCQGHSQDAKKFCAHFASEGKVTSHENCNQFYKCANGKAVPFFCPSQLVFNSKTKECDWRHNVNCGSRPIVEENEADCDPEVVQPDQGANCDPAEAPRICASDNSDGVLVAHENCNQFYKCAHGAPVSFNCYGNLLFNPYKGECDWPENVKCDRTDIDNGGDNEGGNGDTGVCNCKPNHASHICAAPGSSGILVAHENCNQFYKCDHGVPVAMKCNNELLYNPHTEQCDWPHNVKCGDRPIPEIDNGGEDKEESEEGNVNICNCNPSETPGILCAKPGSNGILIAHEKCNKFYMCSNGVPVAMNCNAGLLYNPHTEECDWPYNVNCVDRPIIEIENSNEESEEKHEGTCNCDPNEAPAICAAPGSNGVLIAHRRCNKFYKCDHGNPVTMNCNLGLLYNPYTEQCDWPHKVNCNGRSIV